MAAGASVEHSTSNVWLGQFDYCKEKKVPSRKRSRTAAKRCCWSTYLRDAPAIQRGPFTPAVERKDYRMLVKDPPRPS